MASHDRDRLGRHLATIRAMAYLRVIWRWARAEGAHLYDADGNRYLDCLAGYSALNFGHGHPRLVEAAHRQIDRLTLTSRNLPSPDNPRTSRAVAPSRRRWSRTSRSFTSCSGTAGSAFPSTM